MFKLPFIITFLLLLQYGLSGQSFEIPKGFPPAQKQDYAKFEKDVLSAIRYLQESPSELDKSKRDAVSTFLMQWISATPTVSVSLRGEVLPFGEDTDLLIVFLGGYVKYAIEHPKETVESKRYHAGIKATTTFYKKNKAQLSQNQHVEKMDQLDSDGKLEDWIKEKLEKNNH